MDLGDKVARTLDKYLRHRFSDEKAESLRQQSQQESQHDQQHPDATKEQQVTNQVEENKIPPEPIPSTSSNVDIDSQIIVNTPTDMPKIALVTTRNTQPCCATVRDDTKYLAMGFEDSRIELLSLVQNSESINFISFGDVKVLRAHSGPVYSVKFIRDDLMLSVSEDTTIRLWSLERLESIFIYRGHNYPIWCLELSPRGGLFATGSMDTTSRLWAFDKQAPIRILSGHDKDVECATFHPNEKYVATGSRDKTVRMWSVSDGRMVRVMVGHKDKITSLSYLPNGQLMATASQDGCIKIWNLTTNIVKNEYNIPACFSLTFNFVQNFISTCGVDNVFRVWKLNNLNELEISADHKSIPADATAICSQFVHESNILFVFGVMKNKVLEQLGVLSETACVDSTQTGL